jgi:hypothetical protein
MIYILDVVFDYRWIKLLTDMQQYNFQCEDWSERLLIYQL